MALGTPWGLFRHYWVLISFGSTLVATVVLVLHRPDVSAAPDLARTPGADLDMLGIDVVHPGIGLAVLLVVRVLNVYKPRGMTRYGPRINAGNPVGPRPQRTGGSETTGCPGGLTPGPRVEEPEAR